MEADRHLESRGQPDSRTVDLVYTLCCSASLQVCILIDPNMTLSSSEGVEAPPAQLAVAAEVDTKKLVQVREWQDPRSGKPAAGGDSVQCTGHIQHGAALTAACAINTRALCHHGHLAGKTASPGC